MAPTGDPMLWSAADAAAWLEENYPDAADKARAAGVTGSVLCGMPEEELKEVLGLSLIARRKVGGKLKALHEEIESHFGTARGQYILPSQQVQKRRLRPLFVNHSLI